MGYLHQIFRQYTDEIASSWPVELKHFLVQKNITKPTIVQEKTLATALQNRDLVGIARTGSGKTLAFVIPAVLKLMSKLESGFNTSNHIQCLVLEPTRELAQQTGDVFQDFRRFGIHTQVAVGGSSKSKQIENLEREKCHVLVATPGRLNDLIRNSCVNLSKVEYFVIDEADRMLDMGFEPQLREIVGAIPKHRQTLMWSATWPHEIRSLAAEFMGDFDLISIDSHDLRANPNIVQTFKFCDSTFEKMSLLVNYLREILSDDEQARVLIFANTKRRADEIMYNLMKNRIKSVVTHGDKSHRERFRALELFKKRFCNVMVASDVAARGLDIDDISHVVNFDMPLNLEDYIHRIGRTARHDKSGTSMTFLSSADGSKPFLPKLVAMLKSNQQEVPEELESLMVRDAAPQRIRYNNYRETRYRYQ